MRRAVLAAWTIVLGATVHAAAPDPALDAAGRLIEEGVAQVDRGDLATACGRFAAAGRLAPSVRAKGLEAGCLERLGRVGAAWRAFDELRTLASAAGDHEAAAFGAAGLARLTPRVPRLAVEIDHAAPSTLAVRVDGREVDRRTLEAGLALDPGAHRVSISTPATPEHTHEVTLGEGEDRRLWVTPPRPATRSPRATAGLVMLGAGGVALLAAGALGGDAWRRWDDAGCRDDGRCETADALAQARRAGFEADLASGFALGGAALVGVGAWLWLADPAQAPADARAWRFEVGGGDAAWTLGASRSFP